MSWDEDSVGKAVGSVKDELGLWRVKAAPWPDPVPLRMRSVAEEYPAACLPKIIHDAIEEVKAATQAPPALIAASTLSVVSACVQGLASVARDKALVGPCSLYFLTIAASGERKTACDKLFSKPLRDYELHQKALAAPKVAEHAAALKLWEAQDAGYQDRARKSARDGKGHDLDMNLMTTHESARPIAPLSPRMIHGDATPEALAAGLAAWPVTAVLSAEAGIIFGAHGMNPESVMRNLTQLNIFWDGGPLRRDRTTSQSIDIDGMRVTVGLQVQRAVLENFLERTGDLARGSGFLARFLLCEPETTMGTRFYREPADGMPALAAFHERARVLLSIPMEVDRETRRLTTVALPFDAPAKTIWRSFYDEVEENLRAGGVYFDIRDTASKAAENAARIACCLHVFDGVATGSIGPRSVIAAVELTRWYLGEALRFSHQTALPAAILHADLVEQWATEKIATKLLAHRKEVDQSDITWFSVKTKELTQFGPPCARDKATREAAIDTLDAHHRAKVVMNGREKYLLFSQKVIEQYI